MSFLVSLPVVLTKAESRRDIFRVGHKVTGMTSSTSVGSLTLSLDSRNDQLGTKETLEPVIMRMK